jgi:hypothetical protein
MKQRIGIFAVCVIVAIIPAMIAYWLSNYSGLLANLAYWFFSMWAIAGVLMGLWGLITGELIENMDKIVLISFIINFPVQILIANIL